MAIDFSFPEETQVLIQKVRDFCDQVVKPCEKEIAEHEDDRGVLVKNVIKMRKTAQEWGLWLPHMPEE
jgi:acyl-CoA dehydrogenase